MPAHTPEWVAEETRLWAAMWNAKPVVASAKRPARALAVAKARNAQAKMPRGWVADEFTAVARSWRAYEDWIGH